MAKCILPLYRQMEDSVLLEGGRGLQTQMAKCRQDFRELSDRLLDGVAPGSPLDHVPWRNAREDDQDILEAVLWEQLAAQEGELAEEAALAEKLRKKDAVIKEQEEQLQQLQRRLREGRDLSALLCQLLRGLLVLGHSADSQGQAFRRQLAEGHRLAEHLLSKLSPENQTTDPEENEQVLANARLTAAFPQWTEAAAQRHSSDGLHLAYSSLPDMSDSYWPYRSSAVLAWEREEGFSAQPGAGNHPGSEEEEDKLTPNPRRMSWEFSVGGEDEVLEDSLDEHYLTPSAGYDPSDYCGYYEGVSFSPAGQEVSAQNGEELGLDACVGMKTLPGLGDGTLDGLVESRPECRAADGVDAPSLPKPKVIKKRLPFCKCRIACHFPGLQI